VTTAVLDLGKSTLKLVVLDDQARELHVAQRANRVSERGGASMAQDGSAPAGWSMKNTQVPSGSRRCTFMP
jgi:hypothetical protein